MNDLIDLAGIVSDSIVDGPGIRTVIFVQGCIHHCRGCQNPQSWSFGTGHTCTVEELCERIKRNPLCRGVTFSGGEPFCQAGPLAVLAQRLKSMGYEIAVYSGYTFEELVEGTQEQIALLGAIDVLVDGRFILDKRNLDLRFRGSSNQRILDVPKSLAAGRALWYEGERWVGDSH